MKVVKVMSIIGIVIFSLSFLVILFLMPETSYGWTEIEIENAEVAIGWGLISSIWGIAFAITCLVQATKKSVTVE